MEISETKKGELFQFMGMIIVSFLPSMTLLSTHAIHPLYSVSVSMLIGSLAAFLFSLRGLLTADLLAFLSWRLFPVTVALNIIIFGGWFVGISLTTAGNAAIIHRAELIFTIVFFSLVLGTERYTKYAYLGALVCLAGLGLVLFDGTTQPSMGDLMILGVTILMPIGNLLTKKARAFVPSNVLISVRSLFTGLIIFAISLMLLPQPSLDDWKLATPFILFNGLLFFWAHKWLWTEAISRIPIPKALIIGSLAPVLALIWAFFLLEEIPTVWQIAGTVLIMGGVFLITRKNFTL